MLAVPAAAAALLHPVAFRQRQRRLAHNARNYLEPLRTQAGGINGGPGIDQGALAGIDPKHLAGKGPEIVNRALRAAVAFLSAVAEPDDPFRRMPQMIGTFLFGFGGNRR